MLAETIDGPTWFLGKRTVHPAWSLGGREDFDIPGLMFFCSMVQIQSESLNNVVLRKQKPDPVSYVLVSEEAVVTRAKNAVVALQTTLMPRVPAMAAMLSALFTPMMEVR